MKGLLFVYVMTYGGTALSLIDPLIGVLVYICFATMKPEALWFYAVPKNGNFSFTVAMGFLAGWAIRLFGNWNFGRAWPTVISIVGFWLWMVASATQAPDQQVAWDYVILFAKIVLPWFVGLTMLTSVNRLKMLVWTLVLSQGYLSYEFNAWYYFKHYNWILEGYAKMGRAYISIGLVTTSALAFFLILHTKPWWGKLIAALCFVFQVHAILLSYSRGGLLGLLVFGAVAFFLIPKKPQHYVMLFLAGLIGLLLSGDSVRERFMTVSANTNQRDWSAESRLHLWQDCTSCMLRYPFLGAGPDHWHLIAEEYGWEEVKKNGESFGKEGHTLWLQTGAEMGIPGFLLLIGVYATCVWRLLPLTREKHPVPDPWLRAAARMTICAICGFALSAQFVTVTTLEPPYYTALIGAGTLRLYSNLPRKVEAAVEEEEAA